MYAMSECNTRPGIDVKHCSLVSTLYSQTLAQRRIALSYGKRWAKRAAVRAKNRFKNKNIVTQFCKLGEEVLPSLPIPLIITFFWL